MIFFLLSFVFFFPLFIRLSLLLRFSLPPPFRCPTSSFHFIPTFCPTSSFLHCSLSILHSVPTSSSLPPLCRYKKTQETLSQAGQKTSAAFTTVGTVISKRLGDMRNSATFKSFEDKMGNLKVSRLNNITTGCVLFCKLGGIG